MKRLMILVATLLASLGFAQSVHAADWGPGFGVSAPAVSGTYASDASVLAKDDGGYIYVWVDRSNSAPGIRSRVVNSDGSLGPIRQVVGGYGLSRPQFAAVGGTEGHYRIVYLVRNQSNPVGYYSWELKAAKLDSSGLFDGDSETLDSLGESPFNELAFPSASVADDGSTVVAWINSASFVNTLKVASANGDEDGFTSATFAPGEFTFSSPAAAARVGGGGFVGFNGQNSADPPGGITVESDGDTVGPTALSTGTDSYNVRVGVDSTGKATAAFRQTMESVTGIYLRQVGSDGDPIGTDASRLDAPGDESSIESGSVAIADDGSVAIGWLRWDPVFSVSLPTVRGVSAAGALGSVQTLGNPSRSADSMALIYGESGPVAFYSQKDYTGGLNPVVAQPLAADLSPSGGDSVLGNYLPEDYVYFGKPTSSASGMSVAWTTNFWAVNGQQVSAAIYDAAGPELEVWIPGKTTKGFETVMAASGQDPRGPVTYEWDFGDGGSESGDFVRHTFTSTGTFQVKVTATDSADNSTTETVSVEVVEEGGPTPPPVIAPNASITAGPAKSTKSKTATFKFVSDQVGSKFECRLDKAGWVDCKAPKKIKKLKPGKHTFRVRATNGDLIDLSPAVYTWTVKKTKKKRR